MADKLKATLGATLRDPGRGAKPDRITFLLPTESGQNITLHARRIGFLEKQEMAWAARQAGRTGFADMIAASIENDDGVRFTVEELLSGDLLSDEQMRLLQEKALEANPSTAEADAKN